MAVGTEDGKPLGVPIPYLSKGDHIGGASVYAVDVVYLQTRQSPLATLETTRVAVAKYAERVLFEFVTVTLHLSSHVLSALGYLRWRLFDVLGMGGRAASLTLRMVSVLGAGVAWERVEWLGHTALGAQFRLHTEKGKTGE